MPAKEIQYPGRFGPLQPRPHEACTPAHWGRPSPSGSAGLPVSVEVEGSKLLYSFYESVGPGGKKALVLV